MKALNSHQHDETIVDVHGVVSLFITKWPKLVESRNRILLQKNAYITVFGVRKRFSFHMLSTYMYKKTSNSVSFLLIPSSSCSLTE